MNIRKIVRIVCFALVFLPSPFPAAGEDFTNAIRSFLQKRVVDKRDVGLVVGVVDAHGSSVIIERMYDFVSGYKLTRDPGSKYDDFFSGRSRQSEGLDCSLSGQGEILC